MYCKIAFLGAKLYALFGRTTIEDAGCLGWSLTTTMMGNVENVKELIIQIYKLQKTISKLNCTINMTLDYCAKFQYGRYTTLTSLMILNKHIIEFTYKNVLRFNKRTFELILPLRFTSKRFINTKLSTFQTNCIELFTNSSLNWSYYGYAQKIEFKSFLLFYWTFINQLA